MNMDKHLDQFNHGLKDQSFDHRMGSHWPVCGDASGVWGNPLERLVDLSAHAQEADLSLMIDEGLLD